MLKELCGILRVIYLMGLIVVTLFEANRIRGCKQNFFKMIFQRAILDFAAKSELDQSDTSFGDVMVLNKR